MAETNICITLDCGATLEIMPIGTRFQVLEILGDQDSWHGKQKTRAIGGLHSTVWGAIEEVRRYDLAQYEVLSLEDLLSAVNSTNAKIKEYFELHSEYLANTAMQ